MSEHDQQVAVVEYCDAKGYPVFAIPNGGMRHKRTAAMLKAEGVKAGVPDLFLPVPKGGYCGLFVEMKDVNGRKPRQSQMEWLLLLNARLDTFAAVRKEAGWNDASIARHSL